MIGLLAGRVAAVQYWMMLKVSLHRETLGAHLAVSSAYGARMISRLRWQVAEARQLGQYRLGRLLGAGGMGEVYLAEHLLLKRPCTVKLIRPGEATDPRALERFEREVRLTATLSHPNIVAVTTAVTADQPLVSNALLRARLGTACSSCCEQ